MHCHVLLQQRCTEARQFRPQGQGPLQVGRAQGVLFHTDEMQPGTGRGLLLEQLPGAEKVQPGAEACFTDNEAFAIGQGGKALAQAVLFDEHVAGFIQARFAGEVHIVEDPRARASLVVPVELGVGQFRDHVRLMLRKAAILADRAGGA